MIASGEDTNEQSGANEHNQIQRLKVLRGDGPREGYWQGENDTDVKDVAADDVADEQITLAFFGGSDGSDELWQRSAKRNNGERDDAFGNTDNGGDGRGRVDDKLATRYYADQSKDDKQKRFAELILGFFDFFGFFFVFARQGDEVVKEDAEEKQANNSIATRKDVGHGFGEGDVQNESDEGGGDEQKKRKLFGNGVFFDPDGANDGGNADEQKDVDDVATDDVAE